MIMLLRPASGAARYLRLRLAELEASIAAAAPGQLVVLHDDEVLQHLPGRLHFRRPRNRTLIRLRWARRRAKRLGIYGKAWKLGEATDVQQTWRRHGWSPRQERDAA